MEYSKIIAISGLPGLFELVASKSDGIIARNIEDNVTKFVASRVHNFSQIESIEIYTQNDENVNLAVIFKAMEAAADPLPSEKDAAALKAYFENVFPSMDFERVYSSDMKKIVKWFAILQAQKIEIIEPVVEDEEEESNEAATEKPNEETAG